GGRRHGKTHKMRASARTLTPFEIAVRRGRAPIAGPPPNGVHRETHRAAGLAPFDPRVDEHLVEACAFGLRLDEARARHDHREAYARRHTAPELLHDIRGCANVLDTRIRARADEHLIDLDRLHRQIGFE